MKFPDTLDGLRKIFQLAVKLEFTSNAGKINAYGLFSILVLVALGTLTSWIEDFIRMYRPKAVAPPTDFLTVLLVFAALFVICMAILVIDDRLRHGVNGDKENGK
jgi:hypothetical protein